MVIATILGLLIIHLIRIITSRYTKPAATAKAAPLSFSTSTPTLNDKGESLLSLPAELRLQIYSYILPTNDLYILGRDYGHEASYLHYPPLLHVSKLLRNETLPLLFSKNSFVIDVRYLVDLKHVLKFVRTVDRNALGWIGDFRITVGGCLLVDVVVKAGRRK